MNCLNKYSYLIAALLFGLVPSIHSHLPQECDIKQEYHSTTDEKIGCTPRFHWNKRGCHQYSEIYVGAIGYGTKFKVGGSGVGLNDYFGSGGSSIEGSLWGTVVGYTYRNPCGIYINAEFDWATGCLSKKHPCIGDIPSQRLQNYTGIGVFGYNFTWNRCLLFTPYGGIGYWHLEQNLRHTRLRAKYNNWFGVLGGRIDWQLKSCFTIGFEGKWFIPFYTSLRLNEFCERLNIGNGCGYQLELPLKYTLPCRCNNIVMTLSPFYRQMTYPGSRYYTFGIQTIRSPGLKFQDYGAKLYLGYLF